MTESEQKVLMALVFMIEQYLDEYDDEVDSRSMRAGESAIKALADFGLMEMVGNRFGRWTEAGNAFRRKKAGISKNADPMNSPNAVKLVGKSERKE